MDRRTVLVPSPYAYQTASWLVPALPGRRVGMTAYQELSAGTAIAEQFATLHCGVTAPRTHDEAIWHRPRREP
jgi:hypothetical protein